MVTNDIQFKELVDNLKVGVYRCSPGLQGRFMFVNSAFLDILGYTQDQIDKLNVVDCFENTRKFQHLNSRVQNQGYVQNEEVRLKRKDKSVVWCSTSSVA